MNETILVNQVKWDQLSPEEQQSLVIQLQEKRERKLTKKPKEKKEKTIKFPRFPFASARHKAVFRGLPSIYRKTII